MRAYPRLVVATAPTGAKAESPVLVELFTSQGCSSCPPADALAAKLASDPGLVVVTRPVTYWDRLGWKDTLAREENTTLQRAYADRGLAGRNGVYTPQIVIDGTRGTVGSNTAQIRQFIRQSTDSPASIAVHPSGGGFSIAVTGPETSKAELILLALKGHERVSIGSGENGGRAIDYANVLRSERSLDIMRGGAIELVLPIRDFRQSGADRYALVLREPNGGRVLAARMVPA